MEVLKPEVLAKRKGHSAWKLCIPDIQYLKEGQGDYPVPPVHESGGMNFGGFFRYRPSPFLRRL